MKFGTFLISLSLVNLSISLFLVFVAGMLAEGRLLGIWIPPAVAGPILIWTMLRKRIKIGFSRKVMGEILQFGVPLIPHALAFSTIVFFERMAVSHSPDAADLGIYFAAFQLSLPVSILVNSINLQFRPWSDQRMASGDHRSVVIVSYILMSGFLMFAAAYFWVLRYFYTLIVGDSFVGGYPIAGILILSAALRGCYLVVAKSLLFARHTKLLMQITVGLTTVFALILLGVDSLKVVAYLNLGYSVLLFILVWVASACMVPQPWFSFARKKKTIPGTG